MAQESRVEFFIAAHTKGMEEVAKLANRVDALGKQMKLLKGVNDQVGRATKNVSTALKGQAAAANALRSRIDPMFAAQSRFNQEMDEADRLLDAGIISLKEYTAAQAQARNTLRQSAAAIQMNNVAMMNGTNPLDATSKGLRRHRQGLQQVGMQINDFATSVSTGGSAVTAFNQQIGQLGYALSLTQGVFGKFGRFLAGPMGAALVIVTMLSSKFIESLFETEEKVIDVKKAMDFQSMSVAELTEATKLLKEANEEYQEAAKESLTQTLANTHASLENAKARLADAQAAMQQRMANRISIGTDPSAIASLSNAEAASAHLTEQIEKANAGLEQAEERFRGVQAELIAYTATTDQAARALDTIRESMNLVRAAMAEGTMGLEEGRTALEGLAEAERKLSEKTEGTTRSTQETKDSLEEYIQRLEDAANPLNAIIRAETQLKAVYDTGRLSLEAFTHETARLNEERKKLEASADRIIDKSTLDLEPLKIDRGSGEEAKKVFIEMERLQEANKQLEQSFNAIGNTIANVFQGLITGAQSFKDAMTSIINAVINELMRLFVVQQIVGVISGAFAGSKPTGNPTAISKKLGFTGTSNFTGMGGLRAMGGAVSQNTPYIVGEKGPELFMPGRSGTIIPNQNMNRQGGGAININVDARGSTDPEAVRQQVERGILEAAPSIVAAAQNQTISTLRRPRLAGTL